MLICDLQNDRVVCSGPFGVFQAGSGSFAYRREYLEEHRWADDDRHSIEGAFTAGFTRPMVELNPLDPLPGLMVMFPSWLSHLVHPFQGEGERISVAFNIVATEVPAADQLA